MEPNEELVTESPYEVEVEVEELATCWIYSGVNLDYVHAPISPSAGN